MVVLPAPTPVTTPVELMVAILVEAELLQTPPAVVLAKAIVEPTQTADAPLMAATVGGVQGEAVIVTLLELELNLPQTVLAESNAWNELKLVPT